MDYPKTLLLKTLEYCHPEYLAKIEALKRIQSLIAGGYELENRKGDFLKMRPGEEPDVYGLRLAKFTYTNVLGGAISQQVGKLGSSAVTLSNVEYDKEFWQRFRENTGSDRDEKTLLTEIFRLALCYGTVYAQVDKPKIDATIQNKAQEKALGIMPYVCLYDSRHCINWGHDGSWLKFRQFTTASSTFGPALTKCTWKFVGAEKIATYEALVRLSKNGAIAAILNEKGEEIESADLDKTSVKLTDLTEHGVGRLPIIKLCLPDDLWAVNQAYLLALEYLNLENARYDTSMMASYIQRSYEPHRTPDNDLEDTFTDDLEDLESSNATIIKGKLHFNEASGTAIASVTAHLQEIKDSIHALIGLGGNASSARSAVEQSGVSKKMDFVLQEIVLRSYGSILVACYQDVLQLVGLMMGHESKALEQLSVSGFDSFDVDSLESAIAVAEIIATFEDRLAPTALKLFYHSISLLLARNASASEKEEILKEIEQIFVSYSTEDNDDGTRDPESVE